MKKLEHFFHVKVYIPLWEVLFMGFLIIVDTVFFILFAVRVS